MSVVIHPTDLRKHKVIERLGFKAQPIGPKFDFVLPAELEASQPPEARGLQRDEVRLMLSYQQDNRVHHTDFRQLPEYLEAGDLLVINTSGTLKAALSARRADGRPLKLHLSTHLPADLWLVELRQPHGSASRPFLEGRSNETLTLPHGATATLHTPYLAGDRHEAAASVRLWVASLKLPSQVSLPTYLADYGFPIRYRYVPNSWPISDYQTVYATELGSAEMPSAGRAFTPELLTRLVAQGVQIAPLILHTGVASLEAHEPPYEEYYRVPAGTACLVNAARQAGKRVVAVGTTAVRALETVTDGNGLTHAGAGWTTLVITPERGLNAVNGLLTGFHEPKASHLAMLQALAGMTHVQRAYHEALQQGYLWHEFGDLHLILP